MRRMLPLVLGLTLWPCAVRAQMRAGAEFRVNVATTGLQSVGAVSFDAAGRFVVVWNSSDQGSYSDVIGRRYQADGTAEGLEFVVNSYTMGTQFQWFTAALDRKGGLVVSWLSADQDGSGNGGYGKRLDAAGAGPEFRVNTYTTYSQVPTGLAVAPNGDFVVAWQSDIQDPDHSLGVFGQRFSRAGSRLGSEFQVHSYTTSSQFTPDVATDEQGNFVVVWASWDQDGSGSGIFAQRFDPLGGRRGGEFRVNTVTTYSQLDATVAMTPDGRFVVTWRGHQYGAGQVFGRLHDAAGNPQGTEFRVSIGTTGVQVYPRVAADESGAFVVVWVRRPLSSEAAVWARRFGPDGSARGPEFRVNTFTTGVYVAPDVGSDAAGNFVVTWDQADGDYFGQYAQRFGGLLPTALAVDTAPGPSSDGNGVWERGETVDLRPSWRNVNGAAQTVGGGLATSVPVPAPTPPVPVPYVITDPDADYGTIPDDVVQRCLDCYRVAAIPWPPGHVDVGLWETIVPDAQGQRKRWRVHLGESFTDVPRSSPFYHFVETLLHHSVTTGCTPSTYCPASGTTREQTAVFVLAAKEGNPYAPPPCTTPVFNDVPPSSPFCPFIEELARRGVVSGCGGGSFCPTQPVSREQMTVFVLRTLDLALQPPACGTPVFNDVPASSPFCRWIEELARRGVASGCGGGNYCPANAVTRQEMAVFVTATFGLALYGP